MPPGPECGWSAEDFRHMVSTFVKRIARFPGMVSPACPEVRRQSRVTSMGYQQAEDLMADVRRWDANEWDYRDVTAQVYWAARRGPDHDRYVAATRAISQRATAGDDQTWSCVWKFQTS